MEDGPGPRRNLPRGGGRGRVGGGIGVGPRRPGRAGAGVHGGPGGGGPAGGRATQRHRRPTRRARPGPPGPRRAQALPRAAPDSPRPHTGVRRDAPPAARGPVAAEVLLAGPEAPRRERRRDGEGPGRRPAGQEGLAAVHPWPAPHPRPQRQGRGGVRASTGATTAGQGARGRRRPREVEKGRRPLRLQSLPHARPPS